MGEKRRWGNWEQRKRDDGGRWHAKSPRRWGQQNHAGFNAWREGEEGSTRPTSNGWGDCNSTGPSWEKTFCSYVCRVPWRKICDAERVMSIYKNVAEWDDVAGREAFENAKARYWAKINGFPCDAPLPDPNIYIDKVNFDAFIDPELVADLDGCTFDPDDGKNAVNKFLNPSAHEPVPATGWDEAEHSSTNWDRYIEKPFPASGWDNNGGIVAANADFSDGWGCNSGWGGGIMQCDLRESKWNHSLDVNVKKNSWKLQVSWKDQNEMEDSWRNHDIWKNGQDRRNIKRNGGQMDTKYMSSRHPVDDDYQINSRWKYYGGSNRNSYSYEKVQPQRSWQQQQHGQYLGSSNHQRTAYSGAPWQGHNAVS